MLTVTASYAAAVPHFMSSVSLLPLKQTFREASNLPEHFYSVYVPRNEVTAVNHRCIHA